MPQGWQRDRLKDQVRLAYGESLAAEDRVDGNIKVFGSNGEVGYHNVAITRGPTIIIGRKGSFGKVTWTGRSCFPIDTTYFVDCTQTHENLRWLYYALGNLDLDTVNFDSAVPGLSREVAYSLYLLYPPRSEQQRIATYLDESCAAIDAAVAAKRRQIETLDGVRKDVIQQTVTSGLETNPVLSRTGNVWMPQVPSTWELVNLKRISEIQTGLTLGKVYGGRLIERPYLRVANVQDGHLDLAEVTTIEVPEDVARRVTLRVGDVLMTEGGDLDKLGRGTIWNGEIGDCLHQNHIFAIRCFRHKLLPTFLAYLTASQYGRDYFEATGKRTTNLASTSSKKVGMFPIPRPPLDEQERICLFLDEKVSQIGRIQAGIQSQIDTLTAYRKSLIHECVTGQRRITDPDVRRLKANINIDVA
ncbi:MAG: restriction endonuclease subunit S [Nitrospiraceae bacterium]